MTVPVDPPLFPAAPSAGLLAVGERVLERYQRTVLAPWEYVVIHNGTFVGWVASKGGEWIGYVLPASRRTADSVKTVPSASPEAAAALCIERYEKDAAGG